MMHNTNTALTTLQILCHGYERVSPMAYQTVWSFLARHEPWVLELMNDPVEGLQEENEKARAIAEDMGVMAVNRGWAGPIDNVWAVPPMVLERLFPV